MAWKHFQKYLTENNITYQQYLKSEHWQDVRRRYWNSKLHNRTCFACGASNKPLDVHHKTYKRIGRECLMDLCLLCRDCHYSAHKLRNGVRGGLWGAAKRVKKNIEQTGDPMKMLVGISARDWRRKQRNGN